VTRRTLYVRAAHLGVAAAATLGVVAVATQPAGSSPARTTAHVTTAHAYTAGRYIVTFTDEPAASYTGYAKNFKATQPARGQKLNVRSAAVKAWRQHLTAKHDAALARIGASKIYDYTVTNNAVAANLSAKQANQLAKSPGVLVLSKDRMSHPDTTLSPHFLGLDAPGGVWEQLGGAPHAGAGLVVGVIDTGIWPENPSFAGNTGIPVPASWHGKCVSGERFDKNLACNDKLVGARYYLAGFGKKHILKADYLSPRDGAGHGSHTSSTAAGDAGVHVTIDGHSIGTAAGMAPGAKLAMYKVCWDGSDVPDGCFNSDSVAAINQAVADGVDVLNYSIGGTSESGVFDAVAQAFRGAANAGVFVANSAGNSGPGASTLDHPARVQRRRARQRCPLRRRVHH
jgi:hypothetical protein